MNNTDSRYMYKAKRTDNNEWVHGYLIKLNQEYKIISVDADTLGKSVPIKEDTICQCTGMEDNNYKLIFTNDIVEFQHRKNDKNPDRYLLWWNKEMSAMTAIDANKCVYDGHDYTGLDVYSSIPLMVQDPYGDFYDIKVIGNIIDNPELVKVKEDIQNLSYQKMRIRKLIRMILI